MAWEYLNLVFPEGAEVFNETGEINFLELKDRKDIDALSRNVIKFARKMSIQESTEIFGKEGEYTKMDDYNVYADTIHPDPLVFPLSVYGQAMVNDYIALYDSDD